MKADCFICKKHTSLLDYTAKAIAHDGGLTLSHFPIIDGELATKGHLLIEPTRHIEDLSEMNTNEAAALGKLISKGTTLIKEKFGAEHVYLFRINDKVAHLHFHLIPRYKNTPKEYWGLEIMKYPGAPKLTLEEIKKQSLTFP